MDAIKEDGMATLVANKLGYSSASHMYCEIGRVAHALNSVTVITSEIGLVLDPLVRHALTALPALTQHRSQFVSYMSL
jgi:hypothetical protein